MFARIHQYLSMATPMMWLRQPDTIGVLGLALNTCDSRSNGYHETTEQIRELLETAQVLWTEAMEHEDQAERVYEIRAAFRLIHLADILSVTTHA
jgi:hypothetical protein